MFQRGFLVLSVLAVLGVAGGCGGDDESSKGTGGAGGAAGSGTGGSSAGTGGGAAGAAGTVGGDACQNPADQAALEADYGDGGVDMCGDPRDVAAVAKECGTGCIAATDQEACVRECLAKEVTLSDGCAGCVIASFFCGLENCVMPCLSNDCGACDRCLCGENDMKINCLDAYDKCSGQTNTVCN